VPIFDVFREYTPLLRSYYIWLHFTRITNGISSCRGKEGLLTAECYVLILANFGETIHMNDYIYVYII